MGLLRLTLLGIGASRTIDTNRIPRETFRSLLEMFTRKQLRELARRADIPRGRNKACTIYNLVNSVQSRTL